MSKAPAMKNDTNATRTRKPKAWEFSWDDWDAPQGAPRPTAPSAAQAKAAAVAAETPAPAVVLPFRTPAAKAPAPAPVKTPAPAAKAAEPVPVKSEEAKDSLRGAAKNKPTPAVAAAPTASAPSVAAASTRSTPPRRKMKAWEFAWDSLPETPQPSAAVPPESVAVPRAEAPKPVVKAVEEAPVTATPVPTKAPRSSKKTVRASAAKPAAAPQESIAPRSVAPASAAPEAVPSDTAVVTETTPEPMATAAEATPIQTQAIEAEPTGAEPETRSEAAEVIPAAAPEAVETAPGVTEAPTEDVAMAVSAVLPLKTLPPVSLHPSLDGLDLPGDSAPATIPGQAPAGDSLHLDSVAAELGQIASAPQAVDFDFGIDPPPEPATPVSSAPEPVAPPVPTPPTLAVPPAEPSPAEPAAESAPGFRKPQRETVYVPGFGKNARPRAVEVVTNVRLTPKEERKPRERLTLNRPRPAESAAAGASPLFGNTIREAMAKAGVANFDEVHAVGGLTGVAPVATPPVAAPVAAAEVAPLVAAVPEPATAAVDTEELRRQYEGVRIVESAAHVADMLRDIKNPSAAAKPDLSQRIKDTLHAMKRAIADVELQLMGVRR